MLVDIVGLSIFWAVLCLPIVTIGPATAALYYTVYKVFREHEKGTFGRFFRSVWQNLKRGALATLILLPLAAVIYLLGFWYGQLVDAYGSVGRMAYAFFYVLALLAVGLCCWLFPMLGRFEYTVKGLYSTAFQLALGHLPTTVIVLAITLLVYVLCVQFPALIFVLPSCWALAISYPLEKAFKKHMPPQESDDADEGDLDDEISADSDEDE